MLGKVFGFLKTNPNKVLDIADKGVAGVISGIDKACYTDEEKAEAFQKRLDTSLKTAELHIKLLETTANENTTRSITRRVAAILILVTIFIAFIGITGIYFISPDAAEWSLSVCNVLNIPYLGLITGVFFFGNHMINTYTGKK